MIPQLLLYKIAQFFVVMFLGFLLVKLKVLKGSDSKTLSKMALYIFMPAVLLNSFSTHLTEEIKLGLALAFASAIIIHAALLVIDIIYTKITKASGAERASIIYSNAANLIIPIVGYVLGEEWVIYSCAFVAVQIILIWTHGVRLFQKQAKTDYKKIIFNPCILATVIGIVMMLCQVKLPSFVKDVSSSLGSMVGNVGMLIAGMLMADVSFKKILTNKRMYVAVLMRMIICPLIALFILKGIACFIKIPNIQNILLITYLATMTPSASMVTQLSQVYGGDEDVAVSINIVSTILCIATMPMFVMLFQSI